MSSPIKVLSLFIRLLSLFLIAVMANPLSAATQPNIVLIYVDDFPWYGTEIRMEPGNDESYTPWQRTPNLKTLRQEGMRFSRAFAPAGLCGPSRASLQLGQSAARSRYTGNTGTSGIVDDQGNVRLLPNGHIDIDESAGMLDKNSAYILNETVSLTNIPDEHFTMGEALQSIGYRTAIYGKWHVYAGGPESNGYHGSHGDTNNDPGKSLDPDNDPKLMFTINNDAISFMRDSINNRNKPFFVMLSHYAAHYQRQWRPATMDYYNTLTEIDDAFNGDASLAKKAREHAAMIEDLDTTIGILMDELVSLGVDDNTYVVFTSDNGKEWDTGNNGLRGEKWWLWDDALRVPMIVKGPGIPAGQTCNVNVVHYDYYPTFYEWGGGNLANLPNYLDGVSLKGLMENPGVKPAYNDRSIYFHYPHYRNSTPHSAVISGDNKLVWFYEQPDRLYYYDTKVDSYESYNIWPSDGGAAEALKADFEQHAALRTDPYVYPEPNDNPETTLIPFDPDRDMPVRKNYVPSPIVKPSNLLDRTDEAGAIITSEFNDSASNLFDNDNSTNYVSPHRESWVQHQFEGGKKYTVKWYSLTSFVEAGSNMLTNPSFESGENGWTMSTTGLATVSQDTASNGSSSLKMSSNAVKITPTKQTLALSQNTDYRISFWAQNAGQTAGNLVFDTQDIFDAEGAQFVLKAGDANEWTEYSVIINSGVNTEVVLRMFTNDAFSGTVYFDNIRMINLSGGSARTQAVIDKDPYAWVLSGSNDGSNWTAIDFRSILDFGANGGRYEFDCLHNDTAYEYYRFNVETKGGQVLQFSEIELFGDADEVAVTDPFEDWKTTHNITDEFADDDNDGIINLVEFALNGDPNSEESTVKPVVSQQLGGYDFTFRREQATVTYIVEISTNLVNWTDYRIDPGNVGEDVTVNIPDSEMDNGKLFVRLKVNN